MIVKIEIALWALLTIASAENYNNRLPVAGPLRPGGLSDTSTAEQAIEAAGRHPNATHSVSFNRTDDNTIERWAWGLNITDIPVPNQPEELGMPLANNSEGLHIINTQWQLHWPSDDSSESLQSFLGQRNLSVHVTTLRILLPSNITSKYNGQDNGNCSAIIGSQCTRSFMQAIVEERGIEYFGLEGCASTLDVGRGNAEVDGFGIDSNSTQSATLQPGGTLFFETSDTFAASNLTLFKEAESALYLLALNFEQELPLGGGGSSAPSVLCQIVSKDAATSLAAHSHRSKIALWSITVLSSFLIIWQ